jgi:hypothetical protein
MARKTARDTLNEFFAESDQTRATVKAFADAAYENYGSHAYAAGYLESMVATIIMKLPKAARKELRQELETAALKQREAKMICDIKGA